MPLQWKRSLNRWTTREVPFSPCFEIRLTFQKQSLFCNHIALTSPRFQCIPTKSALLWPGFSVPSKQTN